MLVGAVEYAWNVYPSTTLSSSVLLGANVTMVAGVWLSGIRRGRVKAR